jgi:hypothetical protein
VKNEYESCILGLRSERNVDERNNLRLQEEFRIEKSRLISEMYELKYRISSLEERIRELGRVIQEREEGIAFKEEQIVQINAAH